MSTLSVNSSLKNHAVLITGCSSGIGRCAATTLHKRGYNVFATTRKPEDCEALAESGIRTLHLDLDDPHSIENALAIVLSESGEAGNAPAATAETLIRRRAK